MAHRRSGATDDTDTLAVRPRSPEIPVARWVDPVDQRTELSDELIEALSVGDARIGALVRHIRTDLDRYLRRVGRG